MWYLLLLVSLTIVSGRENPLHPLFSWKQLDWNFPNDSMRKDYIESGDFVPTNNLPLGVNAYSDKLFVTVPRWKKGVPANLNYINLSEAIAKNETSPLLNPYPDWEANNIHNDDAIINILRVRIDACDRMWAVDSGVNDILGEFKSVRPPTLIAIDLKTDKIIHRYTFKESDLTPNSFFADSAVDVDPLNCDDAYVYNSDLGGYGLVVYSLGKNDSWRINHNYFHNDPLKGDYNVHGLEFQWNDGLFGLTLSPVLDDTHRTLYFHPFSSTTEFAVSTKRLKKKEGIEDRDYFKHFRILGNKGENTQGTAMVLDSRTKIIYFTQVNRNAVACWDTHSDLNSSTFRMIAQDNETMIFPNDLAIDLKAKKFYLLTDDLPVFQYSELDWNRTNFYIHVASLDDLTEACVASNHAEV